jgi:hypothetical protein
MTARELPAAEPVSRLQVLVNWLALAVLLAPGVLAAPTSTSPASGAGTQKALSPVSWRPMVSWWIDSVPS